LQLKFAKKNFDGKDGGGAAEHFVSVLPQWLNWLTDPYHMVDPDGQ
jgi:hypothetical protein